MFRIFSGALVATLAFLGTPVSAQIMTSAQIEADTQSEALEWFQPDMGPQDFAVVEFQSRCVLGLRAQKCIVPIHPIPPEVAERVLLLLHEGKEVHYRHGRKAFETWLRIKNLSADLAQERANPELMTESK